MKKSKSRMLLPWVFLSVGAAPDALSWLNFFCEDPLRTWVWEEYANDMFIWSVILSPIVVLAVVSSLKLGGGYWWQKFFLIGYASFTLILTGGGLFSCEKSGYPFDLKGFGAMKFWTEDGGWMALFIIIPLFLAYIGLLLWEMCEKMRKHE